MTPKQLADQYLELAKGDYTDVAQFVETLTHAERIAVRDILESVHCSKLIRNLYYDYKQQLWIES